MLLRYFFLTSLLLWHFALPSHAQKIDTVGIAAIRATATALKDSRRHADALPLFQDAARRYALAGDTQALAECQLQVGICHYTLSDYNQSEAVLQESIGLLSRATASKTTPLLVHTYMHYGSLLHSRQQYDRALQAYNSALQEALTRIRPKDALFGNIYTGLAIASRRLERYAESEWYLNSAMQAYRESGAGMELTYVLDLNLAVHYITMGDFEQALRHFQKVEHWLDGLPQVPTKVQVEQLYLNLGALYSMNKNFNQALQYFHKADQVIRQRFGDAHELLATNQNNIGNALLRLERFSEAMPYFRSAMMVADSLWKKPSSIRVFIWSNIAVCLSKQGSEQDAAQAWDKALAEAHMLGRYTDQALIHSMMAETCISRSDYAAAIQHYEQGIALFIDGYGQNARQLTDFYTPMGWAINKLRRYEEALVWLDKSLLLQSRSGHLHPAGQIPDTALILSPVTSLTLLGRAASLFGQWESKRDTALLGAAWHTVQQALRINNRFRQRYQHNRKDNHEALQSNRTLYALGVEIARQRYTTGVDTRGLEQAFQIADQSKAVLLSEGAQNTEAKQYAGVPTDLIETEARLGREIAFYETRVFEAGVTKDAATAAYRDSILFDLKHRQEALIGQMEQEYPRYFELRHSVRPVKVTEVQQVLAPATLLVEYLIDPEKQQLYIFTIDRTNGLNTTVVPFDTAVNRQIRELHRLSQSLWLVRDDNRNRFIRLSNALYRQLIAPIETHLTDKNQLVIVADGALHYLPFELLLRTPDVKTFGGLDYLIRRVEIAYQYSSALFVRHATAARERGGTPGVLLKETPAHPSARLLAFAPVFGSPDSPEAIAMRNRGIVDTTLRAIDGDHFRPLPYSESEVRGIAGLIGPYHSTLLLYEDAHEAALKAELQQPYQIAHVATHSFANLTHPKFSGIACSQPIDSSGTEDGILYAHEIFGLNIPANLVVLSSCESGLGKLADSEGLLGIGRAFAYAGVPNIIYSLWKVNDKAGSELMMEFYTQVLSGQKTYGAALRSAKLKMLDHPATALPNIWAGFLLLGK
jgi:CHAT domain-containing protein/tetratricopeptide (TPR) repeat protein